VGWLSDKTRTSWGPRLPWILGSAVPLGFAMALMWWLPPGGPWV
jgi:GPH family glycoside/pentoside/hexuronide:cation symporter